MTQRRREIGIRLALGTTRSDVGKMMLALGLGWVLSTQLGADLALSPVEPLALAAVTCLLVTSTGLGTDQDRTKMKHARKCWIPTQNTSTL